VPIDERYEPVFRPSEKFKEAVDEMHKDGASSESGGD
jgi:hypothetical protein